MSSFPTLPPLAFGERFRVKSRSGNEYLARFLHQGELESGLFVRLDGGQIARLDPHRLLWSTYAPASELVGQHPVRAGDDVLVECGAGNLRGKLHDDLGKELVELDNGLRIPGKQIYALSLMFRAPELKPGDRFFLHSRSGRAYAGTCLALDGGVARVRLESREEVNLRLDGVDMDTLYVAVPIPRSAYAEGG